MPPDYPEVGLDQEVHAGLVCLPKGQAGHTAGHFTWQGYGPTFVEVFPQQLGSSTSFLLFILLNLFCKFSSCWPRNDSTFLQSYTASLVSFEQAQMCCTSSLKTCFRWWQLPAAEPSQTLLSSSNCTRESLPHDLFRICLD